MEVNSKVKEIEETCKKYGFMDRVVMPYGFGIKVSELIAGWKDYDRCTRDSKSVIQSEIVGFISILDAWVKYEKEPFIEVRIVEGSKKGQTMKFHKSLAEDIIDAGVGVAV